MGQHNHKEPQRHVQESTTSGEGDPGLDNTSLNEVINLIRRSVTSILNNIPHGVCLTTPDLKILWSNESFHTLLAVNTDDVPAATRGTPKKDTLQFFFKNEEDFEHYKDSVHASLQDVNHDLRDVQLCRLDGSSLWAEITLIQITSNADDGFILILKDITERKHADRELQRINTLYRSVIESARGVPYRLNLTKKRYEFVGHGIEEITGIAPEKFTYLSFRKCIQEVRVTDPQGPLNHEEYKHHFECGEKERYQADVKLLTPQGKEQWLHDCSIPLCDEKTGEVYGSLGVLFDINERKQLEEELRNLTLEDELTGLYNRRGLMTLFEREIKVADRRQESIITFFIDLDDMKWINDKFGHQTGDRALTDFASILKESFRESDIVARIGGDEFVVLVMKPISENTCALIDRLYYNLDSFNSESDRPYNLSVSMGITEYDPRKPLSIKELLAMADRAMYQNKRSKQQST